MTQLKPSIAEFILCEDIREELNGKVTIVGLYEDNLAFLDGGDTHWPRRLRHAVFIRVRKIPPENLKLTLTVEAQGTALFTHKGTYEQKPQSVQDNLRISANLEINVPGFGELLTRIVIKNDSDEVLLEQTRSLIVGPHPATASGTAG